MRGKSVEIPFPYRHGQTTFALLYLKILPKIELDRGRCSPTLWVSIGYAIGNRSYRPVLGLLSNVPEQCGSC